MIIERYFDNTMVKLFEPEHIEDLAESIIELFKNPDTRTSLVRNSNKFTEKYNWKKEKKKYLKIISSIS